MAITEIMLIKLQPEYIAHKFLLVECIGLKHQQDGLQPRMPQSSIIRIVWKVQ